MADPKTPQPGMIPAWRDGNLMALDKLEVHRLGLRHMAVSVFVMQGDRTLLQRRAMGKYHTPGLWTNSCCTHPYWGEDPAVCAARRLREELGITGLALRRAGGTEYRAEVGGGLTEHEVVDLYVAQAGEGMLLSPNPAEVMDTAWVTLDDLAARIAAEPAAFTPWLRIYLAEGWGDAARRVLAA
jgi:isopentenyl-diphosphate delta-isomerase